MMKESLTFDEVVEQMTTQAFYKLQTGRYFVALGLEEAEHLRGAMHLLGKDSLPESCGFALRSIGNLESSLMNSLLDSRGPVLSSAQAPYQQMIAEQVLRFVNSAHGFTQKQIGFLLRAFQGVPLDDRRNFWHDIRNCRRRPQKQPPVLPVAQLFTTPDEYKNLAVLATISRIRFTLAARRLQPADAYLKIDTNGNGAITAPELFEGLKWCGVLLTIPQLEEVFAYLDTDSDMTLSISEFKDAFDLSGLDLSIIPESMGAEAGPARTDEGADESGSGSAPLPRPPALARAGRFKLKIVQHSNFEKVWTTA